MQLGKGDKPSDSAPDWTDYNKLIKEIRTSADFSKRVDLMHQAEDMLMDTGAVMPIYYYNDIYMLKSNIKGIYSTIYGMKYFMYATKDKKNHVCNVMKTPKTPGDLPGVFGVCLIQILFFV